MKILINATSIGYGGIFPIYLKAKYWQSQNENVTFLGDYEIKKELSSYGRFSGYSFLELKGTRHITTKTDLIFEGIKRNFLILKQLPSINKNFDLIHSISSQLNFIILPYILKITNSKIKWVTVFDNIVPLNDPGNRLLRLVAWLFYQLSLLLLKKADFIFVISPELKDYLINKGFNKKRLILTGNAIDLELANQSKKDNKHHIDALFIGRINETKGIYDMLEVLQHIVPIYPKFQLAIMGRGDFDTERNLKDKISQLNLKSNVQFLGYLTGINKFNIIKSSKIFLFLSKSLSESFGIALMEAVSCGLPSFVYDLPIYKNIYKNNEVNVFKKGDTDSVAKAIINTFKNKQFENKNGKKLLGEYSWEKIAKIEHDAFQKLL